MFYNTSQTVLEIIPRVFRLFCNERKTRASGDDFLPWLKSTPCLYFEREIEIALVLRLFSQNTRKTR